jgi:hypothetical protein
MQHTLHTSRMVHDQSLGKVRTPPKDDTQFYGQCAQNESFMRFVVDMVVALLGAKPSTVPRPCSDWQLGHWHGGVVPAQEDRPE